jgi:hypothetical protein
MLNPVTNVDVDLSQAAKLGNEILAKISQVREADPVYWSEQNQLWLVTGHREVFEGFKGDLPLTNNRWWVICRQRSAWLDFLTSRARRHPGS